MWSPWPTRFARTLAFRLYSGAWDLPHLPCPIEVKRQTAAAAGNGRKRKVLLHCRPMPQRLGQHFLVDEGWRARVVDALHVATDELWIEIGAGRGEMTAELARRARRVIAIEKDTPLVHHLRRLDNEA